MNKPAFQFYPSDFIMGTSFMTAEEVGGYMRLLCYQWTNGFIPNKPSLIKQLTGVFNEESIEEILKKFVVNDAGNLINIRLESTRSNYEQFLSKQSDNGKKGGRPPKEKNPNETQNNPNDNPKPNPNDNPKESSSPSPSPSFSSLNSKGDNAPVFKKHIAWWTSATKESFSEKVLNEFQNLYPKAFLQKFIDYYSQQHVNGGISINHEMKFSLESKLRDWYSDPKTRERYPQSTIKRNKPLL